MGKQFVTSVCMVCMLCAIHTHCTVHHNLASSGSQNVNVTSSGWLYAERLGLDLNPQLDIKQPKTPRIRLHKPTDGFQSKREKLRAAPPSVVSESTSAEESQSERLSGHVETVINNTAKEASNVLDLNAQRLRLARDVEKVERDFDEQFYIRKVFDKFGDGHAITYDGFEKMLRTLMLDGLINDRLQKDEASVNKSLLATDIAEPSMQLNSTVSSKNTKATITSGLCLKSRNFFSSYTSRVQDVNSSAGDVEILDDEAFYRMCPSLLYRLTSATDREQEEGCVTMPDKAELQSSSQTSDDGEAKEEVNQGKVWLYSTLSIILISLCGLLGVAVIPIMKHMFYQQMLQFFVALAIGTLCGDALLHLLPHAMSTISEHKHQQSSASARHSHDPHDSLDHSNHDDNMYKGLVAALGVVFLFFTEKCLALVSEWRQKHQRKRKVPPRVRVMRDTDNLGNASVGEKLCKHKYSSYPYCYDEITTEMTEDNHHKNVHHKPEHSHEHNHNKHEHNHNKNEHSHEHNHNKNEHSHEHNHNKNEHSHEDGASEMGGRPAAVGNGDGHHMSGDGSVHACTEDHDGQGSDVTVSQKDSYTVILREHENTHHGHSHTHGHVHSPPESMSAVAWMVIMGDGLHNFTDGMAIGAAFSSNIPGGFSTAIAVFCHELPHEVGDFAVLLKAGMSPKQAIFYNVLSSVLCFIGMVIGVLAGNWDQATQWIFAAAAGMFLYIALVDMIPELTSSHSKEGGSFCQCLLQMLGLLTGLGIMFTIAMYEDDLKNVFTDRN